jgi:lysozyme family protein
MAVASYDEALRRLLIHEGGYADHPADPGGPTKFGITLADYRRHVKQDANAADIRAMNVAQAKAIYRANYWNALRCDELPAGIDYAVFDYGVNSGIGRSGKVLRRLLGFADATHIVTDAVIEAARKRDAAALVNAICNERLAFLQRLRTWPVFGRGWTRRVAEVRSVALTMAQRAGATPVGKPAVGAGAQKTAAGAVIAVGGAAAGQAHASGSGHVVVAAIVVLTIVLALAAWLFWRWRSRPETSLPAIPTIPTSTAAREDKS